MRAAVMLYGVMSYLLFFAVFLYLIAFVGGFYVPIHLSIIADESDVLALAVNIMLLLLWGVQHSMMARDWFKKAIETVVPHHIERSTYVLVSTITLAVVMMLWQPMSGEIWRIEEGTLQIIVWGLFALGWTITLISTFLTDHFDLFGLRHSWLHFVEKTYTDVQFTERWIYSWIRHPMMLGLLISFWAVPVMTMSHLVFSIGMSCYIFIGIHFEERAMIKAVGESYGHYQKRTSKIIPKIY
jgi:protein-S-isoprenylcysteine O-methyltransferase Ste14